MMLCRLRGVGHSRYAPPTSHVRWLLPNTPLHRDQARRLRRRGRGWIALCPRLPGVRLRLLRAA
jgi:hypothetical protein